MAEDGQLARIAGRSALAAGPSLSDLLDPVALEERLKEARARRAEALARRPDGAEQAAAAPHRTASPTPPAAPPRRTRAAIPVLIFLAGLGLGGAAVAVLALQAIPGRIAATADFTPATVAPALVVAAPPDAAPPQIAAAPPAAPQPAAETPDVTTAETPPPPAAAPALPGLASLTAPETAPSQPTALPVLEAGLVPPPPPAPADTGPLPSQVFIHYPASASAAATGAREALEAAGVERVEIVPIRYAIGRSNIRYYHDGDRQPATALAPLLATALGGEAPEARDFTDYATPTAPGNVEIWLAGTPAASAPRATRTAAAPATATPARRMAPATPEPGFRMPGVIAPAPTRAQQVERILIERMRQRR